MVLLSEEKPVTAKLSSDAIEIGVVVRDADRSLEFYRDVLGLPYLGDLDFGVAANHSVLNAAAGDGAYLGNAEDVDDFCAAQVILLERGVEKAHHGQADFILQLVDDRVQADLDAFLAAKKVTPTPSFPENLRHIRQPS